MLCLLLTGAILCACAQSSGSEDSTGFTIPADVRKLSEMEDGQLLEADPNQVGVMRWAVMADLFEELRIMVKDYYHFQ